MSPKKLSELLDALPQGMLLGVTGDAAITAPVVESDADLEPGGVFVARRGLSVDGHDFIPRAIERGAAAIVGERAFIDLPVPYAQVSNAQEATGYLAAAYHDFPSRKLVVIGVTGTNGKTTVTTLIHSILSVATGNQAGMISTVAADLGESTADTGLHVTTPKAPQIQALLAQMVANGLTHCVLEMTSHGLAQGRLNGVDIDVAVLTNVTHEHLDYHGSFAAYRAAKGRMFEMLKDSYRKPVVDKIAVINADDPNAEYFEKIQGADHRMLYSLQDRGNYRPTDVRYEPDGIRFRAVEADWGDDNSGVEYFTPLVGQFNLANVMAALATNFAFDRYGGVVGAGPDIPHNAEGILSVTGIPGRMERIDEGQDFTAIVDFAHTPDALEKALEAARTMLEPGKRLICVFGSAGLRDREKRRMMSEISARLADITVLTAEDPRTESLDEILAGMAQACELQGGVEGESFFRVPDRGEAIYRACQMAESGDIVMACGKGHEQSMCFGTIEYPWDDREATRAALLGNPLKTLPTSAG